MDLVLARIKDLEEQARQQASSLSLLSSNFAYLSSENESLISKNEEQDRVIGELSRIVVPNGYWVWEVLPWGERKTGAEADGRWRWSLVRRPSLLSPPSLCYISELISTPFSAMLTIPYLLSLSCLQEKYRPSVPPFLALQTQGRAHPKRIFSSLPSSVVVAIVALLDQRDLLSLCSVSFRLLEVAGRQLYRAIAVYPRQAASLITSRLIVLSSGRVRTILTPRLLAIYSTPSYERPFELPPPHENVDQIPIETVALEIEVTEEELRRWSPLLQLLNPRVAQIGKAPSPPMDSPQHVTTSTISSVDLATVRFVGHWTRLELLWLMGEGSVVFLRGRQRLAWRDCLERSAVASGYLPSDVRSVICVQFWDGTVVEEPVGDDASLERRLGKPFVFSKPKKHVFVKIGFR
ncbi:hypothetical protein BDY24DRAFT_374670 [Mrakia frigida]|uniref:uncharacterized protein n=1 Tax=Mrakia frigida TaxID=29902 RepID=UPI003FCC1B53